MRVLVIGGGGREHALAWKIAQSPLVDEVLVAPGNAGTANEPKIRNVAAKSDDLDALVALAAEETVGLTVVGPEQPLVAGIVDRFEDAGLRCFGPRADAARLEGSKSFAKAFLGRHRIPTARYQTFRDAASALAYVRGEQLPIVIKADGLAAGKGVIIAQTYEQAEQTVRDMLEHKSFGEAGAEIVIEEFLGGEEASFIAVIDGTDILPLASSQDHKARDAGDKGPNTGGMGAYSPAPVVTNQVHETIMRDVMRPTIYGLADDGMAYRGFLYAGLMIDAEGKAKVLEFNCRFGDPETQPILFRLRSDLVELLLASFAGTLEASKAIWDPRAAVGVVMASRGYPGDYEKGKRITGLGPLDSNVLKVFHAGTRLDGRDVLTAGGRVLCTVALGDTVREARDRAYGGVDQINWDGAFWRDDIAYRAIARESARAASAGRPPA